MEINKFIWKRLDHFATWLSNKCWQKLYQKNKPCKCSRFVHNYKDTY